MLQQKITHPAVAFAEHLDQLVLYFLPAVVLQFKQRLNGLQQFSIGGRFGCRQLVQSASSSAAVEFFWLSGYIKSSSQASEQWLLYRYLAAEGVYCGDSHLRRKIFQKPAAFYEIIEGAIGKCRHREGVRVNM